MPKKSAPVAFTWDFTNVHKPRAKRPKPGPQEAGKTPKFAKARPKTDARDGARFTEKSSNTILARVEVVPAGKGGGRPKLIVRPPFVSSTSTSIKSTCPDTCPLKANGCYVTSGRMAFGAQTLDREAMGRTPEEVIAEEVRLIDGAFGGGRIPQDGAKGGRDLRVHVAGDVGSTAGARLLAGAAERWIARGGGRPWIYTHWWREIPREAFGRTLSVLASVERVEDIDVAREAGYAAAIIVEKFPSERAFRLPGTTMKIIPCPGETSRKIPCVKCRLCLEPDLLALGAAIGFQARGAGARKVERTLVQLRLSKQG